MRKKTIVCLMAVFCLLLSACGGKDDKGSKADVPVADILAAVKEAYGEDYLPEEALTEETLTQYFGLDMAWVEEYAAEVPLISAHPDRVVIVKATEGNADAVEEALRAVQENAVNDTMMYPMNVAKIQAGVIVRHEDYVAYFLLGAPDVNSETEEDAKKFAEEQVQKAVDAFINCFQ
ncbi:MAG: DUF4358 domain-containing protein [Lachnospiraceae bacterium]|nr:DUF4358 domain-containing protein [Lachnospiraceae bacterium]